VQKEGEEKEKRYKWEAAAAAAAVTGALVPLAASHVRARVCVYVCTSTAYLGHHAR
jgi:polyferredoxin